MRKIVAIFCLLSISLTALAEGRPATADDIKTMSTKLAGGIYKGLTPKGTECTVTVVDNGGDGTGYAINITPVTYSTTNLTSANASVILGSQIQPRSQITAYGILGFNFESYFRIETEDGRTSVTITNQIAGDQTGAICIIN